MSEDDNYIKRLKNRLIVGDAETGDVQDIISGKISKLNRYSSLIEMQVHPSQFIQFITENFHLKICTMFEPQPQQTKCLCGVTLKEHKTQTVVENILPGTVEEAKTIPGSDGIRMKCYPTNAFGKVEFQMDGLGLLKPSKYIRLADDDSLDSLLILIQDYWKMTEPEPPEFIITITGDVHSFTNNSEWKEKFGDSLVNALETGNGWVITGGSNYGLDKVVGEAVHKRQFLVSTKDRMIHGIRCIGIAKWGYIENNTALENSDSNELEYARYKVKPFLNNIRRAFLNPGHTHFLLIDDGTTGIRKGCEMFRAQFMQKISADKDAGGMGVPSVLLVIGGDLDTIEDILLCLQRDIPVLLCCGTGDLADILSTVLTCCSANELDKKGITEKHRLVVRNLLYTKYKNQFQMNSNLIESKVTDMLNCCMKEELIHSFDINAKESLDLHILLTVIKEKKNSTLKEQLLQAIKWDRPDIAKKLFPDSSTWPLHIIEDAMTTALLTNKLAFVKLFLKRGIVMRDYLTVGRLRRLYNKCLSENKDVLSLLRIYCDIGKDFTLKDITELLSCLLRKHRHELYTLDSLRKGEPQETETSEKRFNQPFRELFIWAILILRKEMARFFWNETQKPLQMAIVATAIYFRIHVCLEFSKESMYLDKKKEFEEIAIGVLEECDNMDWPKTSEVLNFREKYWGNMTVMDLAVIAYDRAFVSSKTCVKITNKVWFGELDLNSICRVSFAIFIPFLIPFGYIKFRPDPVTKKEPKKFCSFLRKKLRRIFLFYSAPCIKMIELFYFYICYLLLFSYVILFDFNEVMDWPEMILNVWVFSLVLDIGKEIAQQPTDSKDSKLREWFQGYFWNKLDAIWVLLLVVGFTLRFASQCIDIYHWLRVDDIHLIYTFTCILSYIRLYEFYMIMGNMGPKLIVLKRMIPDLVVFFLIVFVCLISYAIGRVALLHRERQPVLDVFRELLSLPYWHLFGELDLDQTGGRFSTCDTIPNSCHASPHAWLVPIMLGIYMLIGNILMVNMLIAVFTNMFEEVNANSKQIYLFEIYSSVLQFSRRSILMPPFLIIEDLLSIVHSVCIKIYQKLYAACCCHPQDSKDKEQKEKQSHRIYIENLKLFEKEGRAKYQKKLDQANNQGYELDKIEKRINSLSDLVKTQQSAQYGVAKKEMFDRNISFQSYSQNVFNRSEVDCVNIPNENGDVCDPVLELQLEDLKPSLDERRPSQCQVASSSELTNQRLSDLESVMTDIIVKLEDISQNISKLVRNSDL